MKIIQNAPGNIKIIGIIMPNWKLFTCPSKTHKLNTYPSSPSPLCINHLSSSFMYGKMGSLGIIIS